MKPNVLVFDIEISLALYKAYPQKKPQYLGSRQLIQDQFFICAAWQWEGAKKINSVSLLDDMPRFEKDYRDDYHVVKTLYDVISEADMIVGHNIQAFDWKKLLAKAMLYDLGAIPEKKYFDTLKMARKAGFSYNDLGFLAKKFGFENKADHASDMWDRCLVGDPTAIREAVTYCKKDVPPAMSLYQRFRPYFPTQINHNLFRGDGVECCPVCGSTEFIQYGHRYTSTGKTKTYKCSSCGKRFTDGKRIKGAVMR